MAPALAFLSCAFLILGCAPRASQSDLEVGIHEGQLAPEFELEDVRGQTVKLRDYRGQVVLINFWATWCSYCRIEFPDIQRAYESNQDKGFVVLAINVQDRKESVQAYVQELGLTFPVLLDPLGRASGPYKARGLPTSYFVDQQGVIVLKKVGPVNEPMIEQVLARTGVE
jgi:peroxiredoxin